MVGVVGVLGSRGSISSSSITAAYAMRAPGVKVRLGQKQVRVRGRVGARVRVRVHRDVVCHLTFNGIHRDVVVGF